jgi:very-short-patch-repair endonuclease
MQRKARRLTDSARELRRRETVAEAILWTALRGRQVAGLKFRRQRPAGPFVLDFYCPDHRLVVEVDGGIHDEQREQDAARTAILEQYGYRVLRFRNEEIESDFAAVLARITEAAQS